MATYNELVGRIEVATIKLEQDVLALKGFLGSIENIVDGKITTLLQQVTSQANAAAASAQAALASANKSEADAAAALAALTQAQAAATAALASVAQAEQIKAQMLAAAPFQEAPINGQTYGRKDAAWVLVGSGGGGGGGSVVSVNGNLPNAQGNVTIAIPKATSDLTNDSGFITASALPKATSDLTNNSGFITLANLPAPAIATDAPANGKQYARKDNAWAEVVSGGGGSSYEYPNPVVVEPDWTFDFIVNPILAAGLLQDFTLATSQTFLPTAAGRWTQDGKVPLTTNPYAAIDIRSINVVRVRTGGAREALITNRIVNDFNPAIGGFEWFIETLGPRAAFLDSGIDGLQLKKAMLPGKYFIPAGYSSMVSGGGFPASMVNFPAMMEVTQVANRRCIFLTFLPGVGGGATTAASKLTYFWDYQTNTWRNLGTGTA